jgi:hypothetical protein
MSTKTLRKRVALAAVVALGAGVLTAAPSSAAVTSLSSGTGFDTLATARMCSAGTPTASATPRYFAVGGTQLMRVTGNGTFATQTVTVSGPAVFTAAASQAATISGDGKSVLTGQTGGSDLTITFTGVGAVTVTANEPDANVSLYFIAVAACGSGLSLGDSFAQLNTSASTAPTSNIDVTAAKSISYSSSGLQRSFLNIDLNDAWSGVAASASSSLIATATGGCTINFTETAVSGTTTAVSTGTGAANDSLGILNDNTPRTCTVTLTLDGTTVATKTVKFLGDVATLTVDTASSSAIWAYGTNGTTSTTVNLDAIVYVAKDSAGNVINPSAAPTFVGLTGGFPQVTVGNGTADYAVSTTNGYATLDVDATSVSVRGDGTYKLKLTRQSDGVAVYSADIKAAINKGVYTYTAGWDKASYVQGDIMTLTITAKDSAGNPVHDGATIGTHSIAVGGVTTFVTPASTDYFVNGVKKYKYSAGDNASGYGWTVDITNGSLQDAVTGTVQITAPTGGVSNADVLKAIVSLIASINKQIAALQKALLKK